MNARRQVLVIAWLVAGIAGALLFWLVQIVAGGGTIPQFIGEQITVAGGYPGPLAPWIGWAVHLGVSLAYAGLFAMLARPLARLGGGSGAAASLVLALGLGWVTAVIAPPAISVTIGILGRQGWPSELFPLNTEIGIPFWNHLMFFMLCWVVDLVVVTRSKGGVAGVDSAGPAHG